MTPELSIAKGSPRIPAPIVAENSVNTLPFIDPALNWLPIKFNGTDTN